MRLSRLLSQPLSPLSTSACGARAGVSGQELERAPRNYGHLIGLAARHARMRLDGTTVVNRASGLPITLTWPRGLREAAAPGSPAELLLALPALPKLLEKARYLGAFPDPQRRADVQRMHGFAANADVAGRPVALCLLARENRRGECSFDRAIVRPLDRPRRQDGGVVPVDGIEEPGPPPNNEGGESKPPQPTPDEFKPGWEPEMGAPMAGGEHLPPGDAREAYQHGYTLEEWQARKHGESWRPPSPPEPGFWTRLGGGLYRDLDYRFGGPYGLPPEIYELLGGDRAPIPHLVIGPVAKAIDLFGNPNRGPGFVWDAATRTAAELIHSAGSSEDPERIKGELQEGAAAVLPVLGEFGVRAPEFRNPTSSVARPGALAKGQPYYPEGSFSVSDWTGYPSGVPKPDQPLRLLDDAQYQVAKNDAMIARKKLRAENPNEVSGMHVHHLHPVRFGGHPSDEKNFLVVTPEVHYQLNTFWGRLKKDVQ